MTTFKFASDAWVAEATPAKNHGKAAKTRLSNASSANELGFLHIPRHFPYDATITTATLRLKLAGPWSGQTITIRRLTETWKEDQINWSNKPAKSDTNAVTVTVTGSDGDEITFDLSAMMADVASGVVFHGVRLETNSSTERKLYSCEHPTAELRPQIDLDWKVAPEAPINLLPGGGLAVSLDKSVLSWQFAGNDLGTDEDLNQSASQVQISTSADFSSPAYDSGMVANVQSSWDMATTSYSIADAATRYWRVRVTDDGGAISDWSETQSFTRHILGTLTLDNPPPDPDNQVDDLTPTIGWEYSDTQESWALLLYRVSTNGARTLIYREPRKTSDDTLFTLPSGLIKSGRTYEVDLFVWDDVDRIQIQGDPGYVTVSQEFTYSRAGGVDPVTAITATPDGAKVEIEITRTAAPDLFCLVVDGVEVDDSIDPEDVHVSGTTYRFDYWGAIPRVESEYEVEARVLVGDKLKNSDGNATDTATTRPTGIYLVDPDDSVAIRITGPDDSVDVSILEQGTTYTLVGARAPVRILDALMGYGGTVQGHVGSPAEQDAFYDLKGRLKPCRLIWGNRNILVWLEESAEGPTRYPGDRLFRVQSGFFQLDADETFAIAGG